MTKLQRYARMVDGASASIRVLALIMVGMPAGAQNWTPVHVVGMEYVSAARDLRIQGQVGPWGARTWAGERRLHRIGSRFIIFISLLPFGSKSDPPLPPPIGKVVKLFLNTCSKAKNFKIP